MSARMYAKASRSGLLSGWNVLHTGAHGCGCHRSGRTIGHYASLTVLAVVDATVCGRTSIRLSHHRPLVPNQLRYSIQQLAVTRYAAA